MDQELKQYLDSQFAQLPTKAEFNELKEDVGVLKTKVNSVQTKLNEMEVTLNSVNTRDKEDSNAFAKDILKHDTRITKLETDVHALKLQKANA